MSAILSLYSGSVITTLCSQVVEIYKKNKQKNMKGTKGIRKQLKLGESVYVCFMCCLYVFVCVSMVPMYSLHPACVYSTFYSLK